MNFVPYFFTMKAIIKVVTAQKKFSSEDLDAFRRVLNMLRAHDLSVCLTIKQKTDNQFIIYKSKLKSV
jgi:hypothetical protein